MRLRVGATGLLERHAGLLFDLDADGRILAVNEPEADPPPTLWLGRGADGSLLLSRHDADGDLLDRVAGVLRELPAWDGAPLADDWVQRLALAAGASERDVERGPAFLFPEPVEVPAVEGVIEVDAASAPLLETHFPFTRRHLDVRSPVTGVVRDGTIVAICMACRTRPDTGEVGLVTLEAWRGRGFARALVARWRAAMDAAGRTPFYSTSWDNDASLAVARSLRLEAFAEELSLR